jgi:hypothetical protein
MVTQWFIFRTGLKMVDCDHKFISPHNYYAFTNDLNTLLGMVTMVILRNRC